VLYVEFDFETAHQKLKECQQLFASDFFLAGIAAELLEQARQLVFETYARIHQCVDIGVLAQRLDIKEEESEQKIVELIKNARVDVKIDSKKNQIVMDSRYPSIYQQVREMTESFAVRTNVLMQEVEKKVAKQEPTD